MENPRIGFNVDSLLAPAQALAAYFSRAQLRSPQIEVLPLENAFGRVLAQRICADAAYPVAPRSAMDGFAVRAAETPGRLRIVGEIRMGHAFDGSLTENSAVRIPTGGVLPAGANAVVPIEDARVDGSFVEIHARIPADDCVNAPGSDMLPGEELLEPGRRIGGAELGLLATLGFVAVQVFRRPVIGVLSSGDELVEASAQPTAAQVRDSNRWAVAGALQALGASIRHFPTAPDEPSRLEALLKEAVATCDGVALTGGSSVGERDLTPQIVDRLGKPGVLIHGLKVKPGKPTVLACVDGKPVIGLPGNPASALMIMEAVAAPIIAALTGAALRSDTVPAQLAAPLSRHRGWTWYVPVRLEGMLAHPLQIRSGSASLLARASGFTALDESIESLPSGAPVQVTRFRLGGLA
jgi:molybdenum cofactor synthesis domain-containing protein